MGKAGLQEKIETVADYIVESKRIVAFTGAGVSTESGIPDFRSPGGLWSKFDPADFTIQKFISDERARKKHWEFMTKGGLIMTEANPNPSHYAIAELEALGKLYALITQNVDGLHQKAGVSEELVFQLHGDMSHAKCLDCGNRYPMDMLKEWLKQGIEIPECPECQGILKPDAVFFGETLPAHILLEATRRSQTCDMCIVLGSSLVVYPAANLPIYARQANAKVVIINVGPTDLDKLATVRIDGKAGEIAPRIMDRVKEKLNA